MLRLRSVTVINKISTWVLGDTKLFIDKIRRARGTAEEPEPEPWSEPKVLARALAKTCHQRLRHWCSVAHPKCWTWESRDIFGDESASGVSLVLEAAG